MPPLTTNSIPALAAGTLAAIGTAVMAGWAFGVDPLMTVFPGLIRMKPNTSLGFLLAAFALYVAPKKRFSWAQAGCALSIVMLGMASLFEFLWNIDLGIDQWLFRDPVQTIFPGRMAQITAFNFVLTGAMLFPFRSWWGQRLGDGLALVVCSGAGFAIVGYLYGVPLLYGSIHYTAMAIHTGVAFLVVSVGFLFISKPHGLVRIFRAETAGGLVARRLIPAGIFIPIMAGAAFCRFNFGQLRLGIACIVVCNLLLFVAAIWTLARTLDKSEVERGMAQHASEIDALTGIHNRRYLDGRLREEIQRSVRHSRRSCLILFDIDHFKALNDRFGHVAGDEVLRTISQACATSLRASDVICRYGGEEFAIIAPETAGEDAMILARKIRSLVALLLFEKAPIQVTISLGAVEIGNAPISCDAAIAAADEALYAAKKMGRNCECLYGEVGALA
jgi:diguanylate cyclase (GGDEF)-like protein